MGREQLTIFAGEGVDLARVIVGHSCGSADLRYHVDMLDRGAYARLRPLRARDRCSPTACAWPR